MGSNSGVRQQPDTYTPHSDMVNEVEAYQGIVGIIGRLGDQNSVTALTLGELIHANIGHDLSPRHDLGRRSILKIAGFLEARRVQS